MSDPRPCVTEQLAEIFAPLLADIDAVPYPDIAVPADLLDAA